ncbi:hypothetical protein AK51_01630 [Serratia nematodiphila DZ0503SBS1]|nr:hypothetical protein AK51_01630 [Serratia nematodiphila DZ0503SBS1]
MGVLTSTVAGRLMIIGRCGPGCQTSATASQISSANSNSVKQKVSGEYSKHQAVSGCASHCRRMRRAPFTASATVAALSWRNTMSRNIGAVALYRCTIARGAPCSASKVRSIRSSRDCVSTWIVTSSGISRSSISVRTKSKSVCDAEGNATSISLKPHCNNN